MTVGCFSEMWCDSLMCMYICMSDMRFGVNLEETRRGNNCSVRKLFRILLWIIILSVASFFAPVLI